MKFHLENWKKHLNEKLTKQNEPTFAAVAVLQRPTENSGQRTTQIPRKLH